jgi:coenzyme PQQ synthesis protein D (PqqD)
VGTEGATPEPSLAIGDATVVFRNEPVPAISFGEGLVLLSIAQGRYVGLDSIGRAIWDRLGVPRSFAELVAELAAAYDAPLETIARDVRSWLERLSEAGVLVIGPEPR